MHAYQSPFFARYPACRLKPLPATIRFLLLTSLTMTALPAGATGHSPLPVGADQTAAGQHAISATGIQQGQTLNLNPAYGTATETLQGDTLTIKSSNEAVINWNSFNIDKGYVVDFQQPATNSVVLNNIGDQNASAIYGTLTANGQVYLFNQNGFVFGPNASVNVGSLVATTLGISQADLLSGIGNVFTNAYNAGPATAATQGAALQSSGSTYLQDSRGNYILDQNGAQIPVTLSSINIQNGARITSNQSGGLIMLTAATIDNAGSISAPGGQIIMAAAKDKVYLQDSSDASVRGMLVEVQTGGQVNNSGTVQAGIGGNVTMLGFAVNQNGLVSATTSVELNGSVRLQAEEGVQNPANTNGVLSGLTTLRSADLGDGLGVKARVSLGGGSVTAVELDDSGATALAAQQQPQSYIQISGHDLVLQSGALVQAPAGSVNLEAWDIPTVVPQGAIAPGGEDDASITVQQGATIDVSGVSKVSVPVADNVVAIKLQSNELSDAPLQRNGILYGKTVYVDTREASIRYDASGNPTTATIPVANIIGSVQTEQSSVQQRSTQGGSISLNSTGDMVLNPGSSLDFAGGSIAYRGGDVTTTRLVSSTGQVYDIASANPDLAYTQIFNQTSYQPGYIEGAAAGKLNIDAYAALLNGTLSAGAVNGPEQRQSADWVAGGTLNINLYNQNLLPQSLVFSDVDAVSVVAAGADFPLQADGSPDPLLLNTPMLQHAGIGNLQFNSNGSVTLASGSNLVLSAGGRLSMTAFDFAIAGDIDIPAGRVSLQSGGAGSMGQTPVSGATDITVAAAAVIDVSGIWVNDWLDALQGRSLQELATSAGSVSLAVNGDGLLDLQAGSAVHADAGAWMQTSGSVTAGNAGSISLTAASGSNGAVLNGRLSAWGMSDDGSLSVQANQIDIGANPAGVASLILGENFFQQGFANYSLVANSGGLTVESDTRLALVQRNLQLNGTAKFADSGSALSAISRTVLLPAYQRQADTLNLTFAEGYNPAPGIDNALTIAAGALISTDAGGSVSLSSDTSIFMNGSIDTPAGNIDLTITQPIADPGYIANQGIWLGSRGSLLARGAFVPEYSALGLYGGTVEAGGNVTLTANRGYIVTASGSLIDVSGTAAAVSSLVNGSVVTRMLPAAGGAINLASGEGMLTDGRFLAKSGGSGVAGGSLSVVLNSALLSEPYPDNGGAFPNQPSTLVVTGDDTTLAPAAGSDIPWQYGDQAWLQAAALNAAGFGSISLKTDALLTAGQLGGHILFAGAAGGSLSLTAGREIVLDSPGLQTADPGLQIDLSAPYVAIGSSQVNQSSEQYVLAPTASGGTASLQVDAQGIDLIGGVSFAGIGQVNLNSQGDLRMTGDVSVNNQDDLGELNLAGSLQIKASRVYPATLSQYTLNVSQTVSFLNNGVGENSPLLSAGGGLTVNAADIYQYTQLAAPFGSLVLNAADNLVLAAGSVTTVSGAGAVVPFGLGSGGSIWLYPLDDSGNDNLVIYDQSIDNLPQKQLVLNADNIDLQASAGGKAAAEINLTGGGDLFAYEFVSGNGGTSDVLATTVSATSQQFAVIPGVYNILTPYDPYQYTGSGLSMGESVYLDAGSGLAAGWYTLLPAHYALLPGAYLVTAVAGTAGQTETTYTSAGAPIVAGTYGVADTSLQNALWQGFEVQAGSMFAGSLSLNAATGQVRSNTGVDSPSQYNDYLADSFIAAQAKAAGYAAPQLPQDAGSLQIVAGSGLTLDANLLATPAGSGLGGEVDISASNLEVVGQAGDLAGLASGVVGLLASDLNNLKAPSLLLGGRRAYTGSGQTLEITTTSLTVASDARLTGSDLLLAASQQLDIVGGAQVIGSGSSQQSRQTLLLQNSAGGSDGALLRVSAAGQDSVVYSRSITGNGGLMNIGSGAVLQASGSMLLDSTQNTVFNGSIDMNGGALALNASRISLGDAPAGTPGLVLASLPANLSALSLNSAGDLDIYGGFSFSTGSLAISAAAINGFNNAGSTVSLTASQDISLENAGAVSAHAGNGSGSLALNATNILLGSGDYALSGFSDVTLLASQTIAGEQTVNATPGVLTVAGNISLQARDITGGNGATTSVDSGGHTITIGTTGTGKATVAGLGASWSFTGAAIGSTADFELPAGILNMTAASGDIDLNAGSVINLAGTAVAFAKATQYAAGGDLNLTAAQGSVSLAGGSSVDLSGATAAGQALSNAGTLNVQAAQGRFDWNGSIDANGGYTPASGVHGGSLQLNVLTLDNFAAGASGGLSGLNARLAAAGFNDVISVQQQSGDMTLAAGDTLVATTLQLGADAGAVYLDGVIDAAGATAGSVTVYAAAGISLGATGAIGAYATAAGNAGGSVTLDAVDRNGDGAGSGILDLSAGGTIDVAGGSGGNGGSVLLRTGRDDTTGSVAITAVNTDIVGAAPFAAYVEAVRVYAGINAGTDNANVITAQNIAAWQSDTAAFMNDQAGLLDSAGGSLTLPATLLLAPGIEVRSSGDLTLAAAWDFEAGGSGWSAATSTWNSGWRYGADSLPGFLTLRAGGDLDIDASISDGIAATPLLGNTTTLTGMIQPGLSWSYDLAAGGNVNLAASYSNAATGADSQLVVRTGTGSIQVQAGGDIDFNIDHSSSLNASDDASAVYTFGSVADFTTLNPNSSVTAATASALLALGLPAPADGETWLTYLNGLSSAQQNQILRYGMLPESSLSTSPYTSNSSTSTYPLAEYPVGGGDIALQAGGDINGQQTGEQIAYWLVAGGSSGSYTSWGVNLTGATISGSKDVYNFNQNVGALGGGNVSVLAGGNISDLSVMIPDTGKPVGSVALSGTTTRWLQSGDAINGGGNLVEQAGNDIAGGEYYVALGTGDLTAGGGIVQTALPGSATTEIGVILDVGEAVFNLKARQDVDLETAMNPNVLLANTQKSGTVFFDYADTSAVNLQSVAGNVAFLNNYNQSIQALKSLSFGTTSGNASYALTVYPGSVSAAALSGSIYIDAAMRLFPSPDGSLQLLARQNVELDPAIDAASLANASILVTMSGVNPDLLPAILTPTASLNKNSNFARYLNSANGNGLVQGSMMTPAARTPALIVASQGSIQFANTSQSGFNLATAADIIAGGNISDLSISIQNQSGTDVTLIQAGGNISYATQYDGNGQVQANSAAGITVAGPGQLQVQAGGDIDLGSSLGIVSVGNAYNQALSATGAGIEVLAGVGGTADYANFIQQQVGSGGIAGLIAASLQFISRNHALSARQIAMIHSLGSQLADDAKALAAAGADGSLVPAALFAELQLSTYVAALDSKNPADFYRFGGNALSSLFSASHYSGNLNMIFSQIATLDGGDIDLFTPGGNINVGLAGVQSGNLKSAAQLGILIQAQGNMNIYTDGDLNVNQSRVFTEGGGNITAWSKAGSIDAGKGAKSALSVTPAEYVVNPDGTTGVVFSPVISGSGIQAIGGGNVFLAAPLGVVNAGEAGISGNNIAIAATAVLGASNINASGGSVGVPGSSVAPTVTPVDSSTVAAGKSVLAQKTGSDDANDADGKNGRKTRFSVLNTHVVGFGQCSVGDVRDGKSGCGG